MFSSFSGDGEIGISEIHGYKPFGIHNIPLRYTASTIHPQFENEDFISISGVSATKIGPGPLELGYGLDSMLNDLPFFNNGYLGIRESETGLYNFDSSVNDSLASHRREGLYVYSITNGTSTFAINNDSRARIENYSRMEVQDVDSDGVMNAGRITNYKNGELLIKYIGGRSWRQKNGGYLENEAGSILEIKYRSIDGAPLVVDQGGLINGNSEILISAIEEGYDLQRIIQS